MKVNGTGILLIFTLFLAGSSAAFGIDHKNLDEGRPLRLQDAYSVGQGEFAIDGGVGFLSERGGSDKASLSLDVIYGLLPNLQLELGTTLFTDPHEIDKPERSGDLGLEVLYNLNQETLTTPAFGLKGSVDLPTGVDSEGVDFELGGIVTKSLGRLSLHFNGGYRFIGDPGPGERDGIYIFAFGPSFPIGAPKYTRLTFLADAFVEQAVRIGDPQIVGAEAGIRYQLSERAVLDLGVGSEFDGPEDRSPFFAAVGLSYSF
jgi:Putative MetA-pathway of phenol degradation